MDVPSDPHTSLANSYPTEVTIDTLNVCNARCPFCPLFQGDSQMDRMRRPAQVMDQELYDRIFDELSRWDVKPSTITQCVNSETLQDPKILVRLATIGRHGFGSVTRILTNGQFLSEKTAAALLNAEIAQIMIGFDGATKDVYEAHRVRCDYERVLRNIKTFAVMRDRRSSKTKIWIKYVRTTDSQHEVSAAHQLFRGFLNPALDLFEDSLAIDWGDQPAQNDELYFIHKAQESKRADKCSYLDPTLVIQPDGKIGACCWDYNLDISAGGFGDLREAGLLEIWRGQKRDAFRTNFKTGLNLPAKCAS